MHNAKAPFLFDATYHNYIGIKNIDSPLQVKQGAENMIQSLTSGHRDKKLLQEAQQMLDDSRAKIEFLRMRIMKLNQAREQQHARADAPAPNGDATGNKGMQIVSMDLLLLDLVLRNFYRLMFLFLLISLVFFYEAFEKKMNECVIPMASGNFDQRYFEMNYDWMLG